MSAVRRLVIVTVCALVPITARAQQSADADGRFTSMFRFGETGGAAVYQDICAGCHMSDGRGAAGAGVYPALAGNPKLASAEFAIGMILRGQRNMPSFARTLSDQQIADVVAYIRTQWGNDFRDAPTPDAVKAAR